MKNLSVLCVLAFSFILFACSNDDDDNPTEQQINFLKIGDKERELKDGFIIDYGDNGNNLYIFDIVLVTTNILVENGQNIPENQSYDEIYFELFTKNQNDLSVGVYNKITNVNIDSFTFEYAEVGEDIEINANQGNYAELTEGSIEIISNGPGYELRFSGIDTLEREISGYFKGTLRESSEE